MYALENHCALCHDTWGQLWKTCSCEEDMGRSRPLGQSHLAKCQTRFSRLLNKPKDTILRWLSPYDWCCPYVDIATFRDYCVSASIQGYWCYLIGSTLCIPRGLTHTFVGVSDVSRKRTIDQALAHSPSGSGNSATSGPFISSILQGLSSLVSYDDNSWCNGSVCQDCRYYISMQPLICEINSMLSTQILRSYDQSFSPDSWVHATTF